MLLFAYFILGKTGDFPLPPPPHYAEFKSIITKQEDSDCYSLLTKFSELRRNANGTFVAFRIVLNHKVN